MATSIRMLIVLALCSCSNIAAAEVINITPDQTISVQGHSPAEVQAACTGVFEQPNNRGTYFCQNIDGTGISCGGATDEQKNTCDTFTLPADSEIVTKTLADDLDKSVPTARRCRRCDGDICCP